MLYRIRFALFPRGSLREALAKRAMQTQRRWRNARRHRPATSGVAPDATQKPAASPQAATGPAPAPVAARPLPDAAPYAVVCLPLIEWRFRFQRPQQLARRFARNRHTVYFVRLVFGRLLTATQIEPGIEEIELPGPSEFNPYQSSLDPAQAEQMADALIAHLAERHCDHFVCMTQLPFWTPLAQILQRRTGCDIVYDCMDHHAGFSTNSAAMTAEEDRLLACADLVIASSTVLRDRIAPVAREVVIVRNAADYEHFASTSTSEHHAIEHLLVGYYGAIADWFDSDLTGEIARLRPGWRLVLVGSTFSADTQPLIARSNIELTGEKAYSELPRIIAPWDCCIIPFKHTPLTDATNPVKVYEMLAAGKPVVAVGLPELKPIAELGLLAIAEGPEAFVAAIENVVRGNTPVDRAARRSYAEHNRWESRQRQIDQAITGLRPLVSVIIVTYNNLALNRQCLASVLDDTDYPAMEVIVVDNASSDDTPTFLRELAEREQRVRIVLNAENRGFSAANNQGAALARGRYLCFLNNDTVVHGAWLSTLIGHLRRHPILGLVGPVTNAIGNAAKIPVGYSMLADMPAWADQHCGLHQGELRDISMLAFFCVVIPRHVWDCVGTLDERFGAGMFEDDDYNRRVRDSGFEVRLAVDSFVHHWQKASFNLMSGDEYLRIYRENETLYHAKWDQIANSQQLPTDELTPLRQYANSAKGTVIFAPSVGWAIDLAQRPHHLARALAHDGYAVVFDCSNEATDCKLLEEVERGLFLYRGAPAQLTALPNTLLWTFSYNFDFRDHFPAEVPVVYDWIDDLSVFPYDRTKLAALHKRGLRESTLVTCVARRLHNEALASRADAIYLPNAVEEGRFDFQPQPNMARSDPALGVVLESGKPIAGYYGAFAKWLDYELLVRVAELRPDWYFVLIGPDHDGSLSRVALDRHPNIRLAWSAQLSAFAGLSSSVRRRRDTVQDQCHHDRDFAPEALRVFCRCQTRRQYADAGMRRIPGGSVVATADAFAATLDGACASGKDPEFRQRLTKLAAQNTWPSRARIVLRALHASASLGSGPSAKGQRANMERFRDLETSTNRRFFRALATHLGDMAGDRTLPTIFGYAITANDRGREEARKIAALTPLAGKRILDIDCTYGGQLVAFAELGAEPEGVDPDPLLLKLARHNFCDTGHEFTTYQLDIAAAQDITALSHRYDVIMCNAFLERVHDTGDALRRIRTMLVSGGIAICKLPNRDAISRVLPARPKSAIWIGARQPHGRNSVSR